MKRQLEIYFNKQVLFRMFVGHELNILKVRQLLNDFDLKNC